MCLPNEVDGDQTIGIEVVLDLLLPTLRFSILLLLPVKFEGWTRRHARRPRVDNVWQSLTKFDAHLPPENAAVNEETNPRSHTGHHQAHARRRQHFSTRWTHLLLSRNRISIDRLVSLPATIGLTFNYCWWIHLALPCTLITLESISLLFPLERGKQKSRETLGPRRGHLEKLDPRLRLWIFGSGFTKELGTTSTRVPPTLMTGSSCLIEARDTPPAVSSYLIESIKTCRSSINEEVHRKTAVADRYLKRDLSSNA